MSAPSAAGSGSINTVVEGDPASCRETAEWLGKLSTGCHEIGTGLLRARSESETIWHGEAADGFRNQMTTNATDADKLAEFFNRGKIALDNFASELDTVIARINQARDVAAHHGLPVTSVSIESPGPPPPKMPVEGAGAVAVDRTPQEERAVADYLGKEKIFQEVLQTVTEARRKEREAHDSLRSALQMTKSLPEALLPQGWSWAPIATGAYTGAYTTSKALSEVSKHAEARADGARQVLEDPTLSQSDRQVVLRNYLDWAGKSRPAGKAAAGAAALDSNIPGSSALKGALGKSVKGAGIVGLAVTAESVREDIHKGVSPDKAITKGAASTVASAGVGAGMTALAGAGYIGGVVATGGTLLVGTAVAAGVGWAVDNYYDDVKNWITK